MNFILKSTYNPNKQTVVVNLLADWSKAFNKVNHNMFMRILIALKLPQWLLRLLLSYLKNRKMILRFRNCSSLPRDLPGGCPQGTLIGVILYILYINPIGFPGEITLQINDIVKSYWNQLDAIPYVLVLHPCHVLSTLPSLWMTLPCRRPYISSACNQHC